MKIACVIYIEHRQEFISLDENVEKHFKFTSKAIFIQLSSLATAFCANVRPKKTFRIIIKIIRQHNIRQHILFSLENFIDSIWSSSASRRLIR